MTDNAIENGAAAPADQTTPQPQFTVQKIYLKDTSFESPRTPLVFQEKWAPKVKMDLNTNARNIKDDIYEVLLSMTATVTNNEEISYLIEVQQAGIFNIKGLDDASLKHTIGAYCPNILFPYVRENADNLVTRGGFPPLHLAPVNFDAVFAEAMKHQQEQSDQNTSTVTH